MKNQYWQSTTVARTTSVVPTHGFGMGDVCPTAAFRTSAKRHADAAKAIPAMGFQPWSPPVT